MRDTKERKIYATFHIPVAADAVIHQGAIVMTDATGAFAVPGSTATARAAIGRAEESVDATGKADGAVMVKVVSGIFNYGNLGGDLVDAADKFKLCYVTDDQTVGITATGKTAAGPVYDFDAAGVWVEINPLARV